MDFMTAFLLALRAIWKNRTRSMLTALGVIIGVASVIAMVAIGEGAQRKIAKQLENMGTNSLVIRPGSSRRGGVRTGAGTSVKLNIKDSQAIQQLPGVVAVSPSIRTSLQVRYRGTNWRTTIEGVTPEYATVKNWPLIDGEFITHRQVTGAEHICVIGQTVARELFGLSNPVGEMIIIKGIACKVIGLLDVKGASAWGSDQDDTILVPLTTAQRKLVGVTYISNIEVETQGREASYQVFKSVTSLLRRRHRLRAGEANDFRIYNRAELAKTSEESARVFTWLLASIASVSLLVGGIGIMNIMLVSVTERTKEIGIRMALGAKRKDILTQFLLESLTLSSAGGILGVLLGLGAATAVASWSSFPVSVTAWSVILAFSFAIIIGVFFGLHPALKASRFQPIEALRYE